VVTLTSVGRYGQKLLQNHLMSFLFTTTAVASGINGNGAAASSSLDASLRARVSDATQLVESDIKNVAAKLNLLGMAHVSVLGKKSAYPGGSGKSHGRHRKGGKGHKSGRIFRMPPAGSTEMDNVPYNVLQTYGGATPIVSSAVGNTYSNFFIQLSFFDSVATFQSFFDQYRIPVYEVEYLPRCSMNTVGGTSFGTFYTVVDYDDANALTSLGQASDYPNCLETEGYKSHKHVLRPHIAVAAYAGGAFTSYANEEAPWIDCTSSSVAHYGVKTAWSATTAANTYDIRVRAWLQFRNVR